MRLASGSPLTGTQPRRRYAVLVSILALAIGAAFLAPLAASSPVTVTASGDAFTSPQSPSWATGAADSMKASSYADIEATAWVAFPSVATQVDLATASATMEIAVLGASPGVEVDVFEVPDPWDEASITHLNAGALGARIDTVAVSGDTLEVDVSGYLRAGVASFALNTRGSDVALVLGTKEGGSPAQLVVEGDPMTLQPSGSTYFGASVPPWSGPTWDEAVARADATFGGLAVVRVFYDGEPEPWPGRAGEVARPVVVSFKPPIREVLDGEHDAALRTWFARAPTQYDVYWSLHHEPEDDIERGEFTAADYRAAWQRVARLADKANNPRLHATLVIMNHSLRSGSGRVVEDYYPGDGVLDVIAVDAYNTMWRRGEFVPAERLVGPGASWAASKGTGFAIAELGSRFVGDDDGEQRAQWLREVAAAAQAHDAEFVTYWNSVATDNVAYRLTDEAGIDAWSEVVATSPGR